jgi:Ca2+-binding EF-hand superfamily protein
MCLAMGNVVSLAVPLGDAEAAKKLINARITEEELRMMKQFGVCEGDGRRVERAEFMLLCAIRLGTVDISLIDEIKRRYAALDVDGDGSLSISEILQVSRRTL